MQTTQQTNDQLVIGGHAFTSRFIQSVSAFVYDGIRTRLKTVGSIFFG